MKRKNGAHLNLSHPTEGLPLRTGCRVLNSRRPPLFIVDRMLNNMYKGCMFEEPAPGIPGYHQGSSGKMRHAAPGHSFDLRRSGLSPSSPRLQPTLPSQFRSVRSSLRIHRKYAQSGTKTSLRRNPTEPERIGPNQTYIFFWSSKSCLLPALTCQPLFTDPRPFRIPKIPIGPVRLK
jgi:hypothetical protein